MTSPSPVRTTPPRHRAVGVLCGTVLLVLNAPLAFLTLVQVMPRSGPHEFDAAEEFALLTYAGLGWTVCVLAFSLLFVGMRRLRPWWFAPPMLFGVTLLARLTLFPPYS